MNLLDKVAKALKPFADAWESGAVGFLPFQFQRAAEALVAVREAQENPQGFEEWAESEYLDGLIGESSTDTARKAYLAGQLSGIPAEMRETLLDALEECISYYDHLSGQGISWQMDKELQDSKTKFVSARKWLEGSR